jgi:hypothetical protein
MKAGKSDRASNVETLLLKATEKDKDSQRRTENRGPIQQQ